MSSETEKVRFAVVGCGHIGKRHAEMIQRHPEAELVALCDVVPQEKLGINEHEVPFFTSLDALLQAGKAIDVVNICTPNGLHTTQSVKALQHGKHVVCEKPMGLSKASTQYVLTEAYKAGKQVFCVMQNRYSPPSVWVKEVLEQKLLGDIFIVQINCFWNRDDRYYSPGNWRGTPDLDGGTLYTQFSHFVDMMYWLFGDITHIQAKFADFNHSHSTAFEDTGFITFDFLNGGSGSFNYTTAVWDKNLESSMTIIGTKGSIKIGGQYMNEVVHCHIQDYQMPLLPPCNPANDYGHYTGSAANHMLVIEEVVKHLQCKGTYSVSPLDGVKVVEIIERMYGK